LSDAPTAGRPAPPDEPVAKSRFRLSPVGPTAKRRRKRERRYCLAGIGVGLLGVLLGRLADLWVHFDVFSHFALHFRLLALASFIGFLMPRVRTITATVLFVAGVLAIGIWPHAVSAIPASPPEAGQGERALRLMSFNTLFSNADNEAIAAEVERQDPDIVAFMEFGPSKRPLFDRLGARWPHQADCLDKDFCNLVVMSKLPMTSSEARVSWEGPPYMLARFGPEAGNLTLIAVHTIRFPHQRAQYTQIAALMKHLETIQGSRVLMGDFNATPFSLMVRTVEHRSGMVRLTRLPTWPARLGLPQIAIDQIFVSPNLRSIEPERIGRNAGSDHHPIILAVAVPLS
jgi:endonuclease/exonuclease/phosphatase (EEP) superfamily protein YafD